MHANKEKKRKENPPEQILLVTSELFSLHFGKGRGTFPQRCWQRLRVNCLPASGTAPSH